MKFKGLVQTGLMAVCGVVCGMCAGGVTLSSPTLTTASRTASLLSGTVKANLSIDGGGADFLKLRATATPQNFDRNAFVMPSVTAETDVAESGEVSLALEGLIPSVAYDLVVVVVDGDGNEVVSNSARVNMSAGYSGMCYKPAAGQSSYPWTNGAKWYSDANSGAALDYLPSWGDDVLLYSSKNKVVPLRVDEGVSAAAKRIRFCSNAHGDSRQQFAVAGALTNASDVVVGSIESEKETCTADLRVQAGGEWTIWGGLYQGSTPVASSSFTVEEGGRLIFPTEDNTAWSETRIGENSRIESVLTNKGEMVAWDLFVGQSGVGRVENAGAMTVVRKFTIGREVSSTGTYHLAKGGSLELKYADIKPIIVGHKGVGTLVLDEAITLPGSDYFMLGSDVEGEGTLILNNGVTQSCWNVVRVGCSTNSCGRVELNGSAQIKGGYNLQVGYGERSMGHVTLNDTSRLDGVKDLVVGAGVNATGCVEMCGASVITNLSKKTILLGNASGAYGELVVGDTARVNDITNLAVGVTKDSTGLLRMHGGRISLPGGGQGIWNLFVGRDGNSSQGRVRGWGLFERPASQLRLTAFGQFIADGEGTERDLDMGWFRTVGKSASGTPNACGTNGWFAVNKGRLRYPHTQQNTAANYRISGDYPNRTDPTLVNSFAFDLTGRRNGNYYLHADLYAADRSDIPAGLAAKLTGKENHIAGILHAGYFTTTESESVSENTKSDFTSGTISWRYDPQGLEDGWTVKIFRHDGTASGSWQQVHKSAFNAATTVLTTDTFACSADTWNLGWFACVATKGSKGTLVLFR